MVERLPSQCGPIAALSDFTKLQAPIEIYHLTDFSVSAKPVLPYQCMLPSQLTTAPIPTDRFVDNDRLADTAQNKRTYIPSKPIKELFPSLPNEIADSDS